jgi:hypothetical protein
MTETYDLNVTRWLEDHPDHILRAGLEGFGFEAQHRETRERATALTLDELDAKLAHGDTEE